MITATNYLTAGAWREHSYALSRAFGNIESAVSDAYKLNDPQTPYFSSDILNRITAAVQFVTDILDRIEKTKPFPTPARLRRPKEGREFLLSDIHDEVANLMFKLVLAASYVTSDRDRSWAIQHNAVWTQFFSHGSRGGAYQIAQFKLRRIIYDTITRFDFLDYESARVLGFTLNVLGFRSWAGQPPGEFVLQRAVVAWTRRNFASRWAKNPDVAVSGLPAGLNFDPDNRRFIKTYAKGLEREAPKEYLDLENSFERTKGATTG